MRGKLLCGPIVLLAACSGETPQESQPGADARPYRITTDIQQTMAWILEPAADVIWDSAGTIITAQGRQELAPTTAAGWETVRYAAATLAESGNLLMLPGRSMGADWNEYSQGLVAAGKLAMDAVEARDPDALFDAGGRIYQVCRACHNQYWVKGEEED